MGTGLVEDGKVMDGLEVVPSEAGGWDVVRVDDGMALSNHATRETAERAARIRAGEEGGLDVTVDEKSVHKVDDESRGVRTMVIALAVLITVVVILVVVISLVGSLTGFGS
jgi:cell division protein FtsX